MQRRVVSRAALAGALLIVLGAAMVRADHGYWPAGGVDPATVTGHAARTNVTTDPASWGSGCTSFDAGDGGLERLDVYGGILDRRYGIVVVLAASEGTPLVGPTSVTYFLAPRSGEFVWADVDGNGLFGQTLEADIQTLIACISAAQPWTDTAESEAKASAPGPTGPLLLALGVALGVLVALRVRRPR